MQAKDLSQLFLKELSLRIEPEMSQYVLTRLTNDEGSIPIIGMDARTGIALRRNVPMQTLREALSRHENEPRVA